MSSRALVSGVEVAGVAGDPSVDCSGSSVVGRAGVVGVAVDDDMVLGDFAKWWTEFGWRVVEHKPHVHNRAH